MKWLERLLAPMIMLGMLVLSGCAGSLADSMLSGPSATSGPTAGSTLGPSFKQGEKIPADKAVGDGRFIANGNGTVLDTRTSLMWAARDNGSDINWANAKSYCENYRGGGYTDWRMPTQDELAGLYDKNETYLSECDIAVNLTKLIRLTCSRVWAENSGSSAALFTFFFGSGIQGFDPQLSDKCRALPVRSGKYGSSATAHSAGIGTLHFSYDYKSGSFVRRMSGTVEDVQGLWNALLPLQPPQGAHGGYGLLGDDGLLGEKPGYGLSQLGRVARKYIIFESLDVEQPSGWETIGVQSDVFTNVDKLNDTTLGWVFFDVRGNFEKDMKQLLHLSP